MAAESLMRFAARALLALLWPLAAGAQEPARPNPATLAGTWEMSNAERDRACTVTLRAAAAGSGLALAWDKACFDLFPFPREITAWKLGARDAITFINARGQTVLELSEVEGGLYEGERPGVGLIFMQSTASRAAEERKPEQVLGDWNVVSAGRPLCSITLLNTPGQRDTYALRVKAGCDDVVARFNPAAWRFDRDQLVITSARGESWRFEEAEEGWRRLPARSTPLLLVRP